jgi:probable addiction module antidote protein
MSDYRHDLLADLADPEYAAHYVTAAYRESCGAFLIALKDVADARFGMTKLADNVKANRVSLYRALSEGGNPTLSTFNSVVEALNLDVSFSPRTAAASSSRPFKSKNVLRGSKGTGKTAAGTSNRSRNKSRV